MKKNSDRSRSPVRDVLSWQPVTEEGPLFTSKRVEFYKFVYDKHFEPMAEMQGNALVMEQFANAQPREKERVAKQAKAWHDRWKEEPPNFMGGYALYLKPSDDRMRSAGVREPLFIGTVVTGGSDMAPETSSEVAICTHAAYFPKDKRYASTKEDLMKSLKVTDDGTVVSIWARGVATEVARTLVEKHLALLKKHHPYVKTIDSTASNVASQRVLENLGFEKLPDVDKKKYGVEKNVYILDVEKKLKEGSAK